MNLQEMSIPEKINQLEALIAKADLDLDYAIQVKWHGEKETTKQEAKILIENARTLFSRIDQLDYDVRQGAYSNYNRSLDSFLKMFPEFELNDTQTNEVQRHM